MNLQNNNMDMRLNLIPDLRNIVTGYFGDVIFSQDDEVNEVTFATAEEFRKSRATDCHFINYEIISTNHRLNPDIPRTLLRCSGVPKIKTHTLAFMLACSKFNGDLSQWDVSNVTSMHKMFSVSKFNGNISQWDVSSVQDMSCMFHNSKFNGDISQWDVSSVQDMSYMFSYSKFNCNLSQWDVSSVTNMEAMFEDSKFNGGISQWDVSNVTYIKYMFCDSKIKKKTVQSWNNFKNCDINEMFD
jgi:surface protein